MKIMASCRSRWIRRSSSTMIAWTETSSDEVTSSQISRSGSDHQGTGDRDPLPFPAGQLVRVARQEVAAQRHVLEDLQRRARSAPGTARSRNCSSGWATIWPTVFRGLSEVYGFWKMYWTRCSTSFGRRRRARGGSGVPWKVISPVQLLVQPGDAARERGLAGAGLADDGDA